MADAADDTTQRIAAAFAAHGLTASAARLEQLRSGFEGAMAGAARLRALDLGEREPASFFTLTGEERDAGR